jgi:hypothetical protein
MEKRKERWSSITILIRYNLLVIVSIQKGDFYSGYRQIKLDESLLISILEVI